MEPFDQRARSWPRPVVPEPGSGATKQADVARSCSANGRDQRRGIPPLKKTLLALTVLASFGLASPASAAPALPGAVSAPETVVDVRMHRHHHHHMRRHHRHHHHHHGRRHHHRHHHHHR